MWIVSSSGFLFSCTYTDETHVLSFTLSGNKYKWTTPNKDHLPTYTYTYDNYNLYIYLSIFLYLLFITGFISYTFHVNLYFTSCSCNCILSSHNNAMLLVSYHIIAFAYTFPLCILFIFFYIHVCKYLRNEYEK